MSRSRAWCFTINHDNYSDMDEILDLECRYCIFGFEKGIQGTKHIQGYVYYNSARTLTAVKKDLTRAHLEIAKGNFVSNYEYCSKDGHFYEFGEKPSQGDRTDIGDLVKMIDTGSTREEIRTAYPKYYFLYKKKIEEMVKPTPQPDKKRILKMIDEAEMYDFPGAFMDADMDTYENEDIMVLIGYTAFFIDRWYNGFPPKIRRGYEIIKVDPSVIYLYYRDKKEKNYIKNKYGYIIDTCLIDGEVTDDVREIIGDDPIEED